MSRIPAMTPRSGTQTTQTTNRSRTRSNLPQAEPKLKIGSLDSVNERLTTAASGNTLRNSQGDLTARSNNTLRNSQADLTARSSAGDDEEFQQQQRPEAVDMPFFKQDPFTDVVLALNGKRIFTCRALLAYHSPVLAQLLSSGSVKSNKEMDIPDKDFEDFVELLAYMDPRVDYQITEQSAIALLPLAEEYGIVSLKRLCEQTIIQSFRQMRRGKKPGALPVEISLEYLHLADKYDFPGLKNLVTDEFVNSEDPSATKSLLESELISEHVKLTVLDKKVEKVHFELDKERRERTAIETKLTDYGNKRFRRPLPD
ncbi:uncharacterized protein LOC127843269 [Dreissena polymorpha]|uniref:BTB domain-containing protein n=1 Tax=Dreissena polymorpha TaxID=45954 RepID=A0A9D4EX33_DREPO|nr:uncharacterized protein LOC127843269 [Dreissena polymorpha]KAH3787274.1 hypothetical protein DPMN_165395 [Dreissena polymorpha]